MRDSSEYRSARLESGAQLQTFFYKYWNSKEWGNSFEKA